MADSSKTAPETDVQPPMLDGERFDAYTRRTGHFPPHWSHDRCLVQDARLREAEQATVMGVSAADRAKARAYLRRWGVLDKN